MATGLPTLLRLAGLARQTRDRSSSSDWTKSKGSLHQPANPRQSQGPGFSCRTCARASNPFLFHGFYVPMVGIALLKLERPTST
jgi:hypothetical protein